MKATRIFAVLVLVLLVALCMVLTACGSDPIEAGAGAGAHEHNAAETPDTPDNGDDNEGESVCLHKSTATEGKKTATCLVQGYTGDTVCTDCGKVITAGTATPLGACDFEDTDVLLEATCEQPGLKLCTCTVCGDTRNESIKVLGHNIVKEDALEDTVNKVSHDTTHIERCTRENCGYSIEVAHTGRLISYPATCHSAAYQQATCPVCRVTYRIYDETQPATGEHVFDEDGWEVTTEPTCQAEGEETRYCTTKGCTEAQTRPVEIDPDAHKWIDGADTCQNTGCEAVKPTPAPAPETGDEEEE